MTPEESFILDALKSGEDGEHARAADGLDYKAVSDLASLHGVKPLLCKRVQGRPGLPEWFVKELEDSYNENLARNVFLWNQLKEVADALKSACIDFISIKGPLLAEELYGDLGARPMADLDFLVRECDVVAAGKVLEELGYFTPPGYDVAFALKYRSHVPYESKHRISHCVELHRALTQKTRFGFDVEGVWAGAEVRGLDGVSVKVMSSERLLSYLCVHFTHHLHYPEGDFRPKLMWLYDIRLLLERNHPDWNVVLEDACRERTKTTLYATLYLAGRMLGADVPANVLDELKPGSLRSVLLHFLLDDLSLYFRRFPRSKVACTLVSELLIDRMVDRVSFTLKFLLRELEYLLRRL